MRFVGPLLAEVYVPGEVDPTGWWMSEKLDGIRCKWDPKTRKLYSRTGLVFSAPDWYLDQLPDAPLDAELWLGRGQLERTNSIVQSSQDKGWAEVNFCTIDIPDRDAGPFEERQVALKRLFEHDRGPRVQLIPQTRCTGADMLEQVLDLVLARGGEGLMIRKPGSLYYPGVRSPSMLKVKRWIEEEAIVYAYQDGERSCKGVVGALLCHWNGKQIKVGTGFTYKQRQNPPPIGARITFRYHEKTRNGKPRTPSYVGIRPEGF